MKIFGNFFDKMAIFRPCFDIQVAIFNRVSYEEKTYNVGHNWALPFCVDPKGLFQYVRNDWLDFINMKIQPIMMKYMRAMDLDGFFLIAIS